MQTLHRYRPASPRALALLVQADAKDRKTAGYMADLLWARTSTPRNRLPMLREILAPRTDPRTGAKRAYDAVETMFKIFGAGEKNEDRDA